MAKKNLYIGYDEDADELIITSRPRAKTVGYFIDSGTAALLDIHTFRPYGLSFILLRGYFKKHKNAFAKVPLSGDVILPARAEHKLLKKGG